MRDFNFAVRVLLLALASSSGFTAENPTIFTAIRSGDPALVRKAIERDKAVVHARDEDGWTPLMHATWLLDTRAMSPLLAAGADPNATNKLGHSAMLLAAGDLAKLKLLLKHKGDLHLRTSDGTTVLMAAAAYGDGFHQVKFLVEKGADVKAESKVGRTALSSAVRAGNVDAVRLLLKAGADPNVRAREPWQQEERGGDTPLITATSYGLTEIAKLLVEHGADVNAADNFIGHSLNYALASDNAELAEFLIGKGASTKIKSPVAEESPVLWAAFSERGNPAVIQLLHAKGEDLNITNDRDETPLNWAKMRGQTELAAWLAGAGAKEGKTVSGRKAQPGRPINLTADNRPELARAAAQKAVGLVQLASDGFLRKEGRPHGCVSCHHQTMPSMAYAFGADRGIEIDPASLKRQLAVQVDDWKVHWPDPVYELGPPKPAAVMNISYGLLALGLNQHPNDKLVQQMVFYLAATQRPDGSWLDFAFRPPMESSAISSTALALRALQLYPLPHRGEENARQVSRAGKWLAKVHPFSNEEFAFQLLGRSWAGESPARLKPAIAKLLARQKQDGGWAQIPSLESDAYATGQALVALWTADPAVRKTEAYQRGLEFLLRTQFEDGSWLVKTRTWPFQTHFDTGFPHRRDQWISVPGTAWAAMALMTALDPNKTQNVAQR
jgi:ankyrin repeat protein